MFIPGSGIRFRNTVYVRCIRIRISNSRIYRIMKSGDKKQLRKTGTRILCSAGRSKIKRNYFKHLQVQLDSVTLRRRKRCRSTYRLMIASRKTFLILNLAEDGILFEDGMTIQAIESNATVTVVYRATGGFMATLQPLEQQPLKKVFLFLTLLKKHMKE